MDAFAGAHRRRAAAAATHLEGLSPSLPVSGNGPVLRRLGLELTRVCNLRCDYCFAGSDDRREGELTLSEYQALFRAGRCGRCPFNASCYGCRASAYAATGDLFGEDPDCWVGA